MIQVNYVYQIIRPAAPPWRLANREDLIYGRNLWWFICGSDGWSRWIGPVKRGPNGGWGFAWDRYTGQTVMRYWINDESDQERMNHHEQPVLLLHLSRH